MSNHRSQVVTLLDSMTKLMFGLEEGKKSIAIHHGTGSIELAICLVSSAHCLPPRSLPTDENTEMLLLTSALKTMKTSVVRNPAGRTRCRSAGAFDFLCSVLDYCLENTVPASLIDDALTTLAAMCMGNDLNALQGTLQFRRFIEIISTRYDKDLNTALYQKVVYLKTLFDAIQKEQNEPIAYIQKERSDFFKVLTIAEKKYRMGQNFFKIDKYPESETCCTSALNTIEHLFAYIPFLENLVCNLYEQRCAVRLALNDFEGALSDVDTLLSKFNLSATSTVNAQTWRAKALNGLESK